jgi:sn1-specific diacylglycerol lipase
MLSLDWRVKTQNAGAIIRLTGIQAEDIVLTNYISISFGLLPYMIVLDKISKNVVISVRGTVGFADLVTDMLSAPVDVGSILPDWVWEQIPPPSDGSHTTLFGHKGILASSKAILKDMEDKGLIDAMLGGCSSNYATSADIEACSKPVLPNSVNRDATSSQYQRARELLRTKLADSNWGVVVTGHSLGAAVATMLSFKLKQYFPLLKCFAFSPPGGLLSPELSTIAQSFCTSIVVGYDVVSRLSIKTVQDLVDDMVSALCRCKRPKLSILFDHLLGRRRDPSSAPKTFASFESLGSDNQKILKQYLAKSQLHQKDLDSKPLCPAGNIIFMRPFTAAAAAHHQGSESPEYWDAVYIESDGEFILLVFFVFLLFFVCTQSIIIVQNYSRKAWCSLQRALTTTGSQQ